MSEGGAASKDGGPQGEAEGLTGIWMEGVRRSRGYLAGLSKTSDLVFKLPLPLHQSLINLSTSGGGLSVWSRRL